MKQKQRRASSLALPFASNPIVIEEVIEGAPEESEIRTVFEAIRSSKLSTQSFERFLAANPDSCCLNRRDERGNSALHDVCIVGDCDKLIALLQKSSQERNISAILCGNREGLTPFWYCLFCRHWDCLEVLLNELETRKEVQISVAQQCLAYLDAELVEIKKKITQQYLQQSV